MVPSFATVSKAPFRASCAAGSPASRWILSPASSHLSRRSAAPSSSKKAASRRTGASGVGTRPKYRKKRATLSASSAASAATPSTSSAGKESAGGKRSGSVLAILALGCTTILVRYKDLPYHLHLLSAGCRRVNPNLRGFRVPFGLSGSERTRGD